MRAAVYHGPRDIRIEEKPMPEIGPKDALVKVITGGICGSDTFAYLVDGMKTGIAPGFEFGHEYSGIVHQVGSEVEGITEGMRVVVQPMFIHPYGRDFACMACGFSEYAKIHDAKLGHNLYLLPDDLSFDQGALVEPFSVGMHGVNSGRAKPSDKALIYGVGPIGLSALAGLIALGCKDVAVSDISEFRLAKAREMGAAHTFNPQKDGNLLEFLKERHGEVATRRETFSDTDLYIDAAGVGQILLDTMMIYTKHLARIVVVGVHKKEISFNPIIVMSKQLTIQGSSGYDIEFEQVMGFMREGKADPRQMVTHNFPLSEITAAFEAATTPDEGIKVLVHMD